MIKLNKIIILALAFFLIAISSNALASSISIKPFVGFQFEQLNLQIEKPQTIKEIEILGSYDQRKIIKCGKISCPVFENDSTTIENPQKNNYSIFTKNSLGNFAVRVEFNDGTTIFSSFEIKQNYSIYFIPAIILLLVLLFWVEKHA